MASFNDNDLKHALPTTTVETVESESTYLFFSYSELPWINITLNIFTWLLLTTGLVDFFLQSGVILASFISCLSQPMKNSRRFFGTFVIALFIFVRLTMLIVMLTPILLQVWEELGSSWIYYLVTYVTAITTTVVLLPGTIFGLFYIFKFGAKAEKSTMAFPPAGEEPMVAIVMPIYNESIPVLFRAIDSTFTVDYPEDKKHLFLSFDDSEETELYFQVLAKLGVLTQDKIKAIEASYSVNFNGIAQEPMFPAIIDVYVNGMTVTVSRFPHGGKSATQAQTFRLIQNSYSKIKDSTFILNIDSDIILHENALHNFVAYANANPKFVAATGLLTCSTQFKVNIYQYLQNAEYLDSQIFMKAGEAGLGGVTCLPGAVTFVKMAALEDVADTYFFTEKNHDLSAYEYHREAFGEDRYLTYLLLKGSTGPHQVTFVPNAVCKTDAPDTFMTLLKQRRRWILGTLASETYQLTSPAIWKKLPLIQIYRLFLFQSASLTWVSWVFLISWLTMDRTSGSEMGSYGAFYLLMFLIVLFKYVILCGFCLISQRIKLCIFYVVLKIVLPVFTLVTVFYAAWTWNVRSWGGPRADGEKAEIVDRRIEFMTKAVNQIPVTNKDITLYI